MLRFFRGAPDAVVRFRQRRSCVRKEYVQGAVVSSDGDTVEGLVEVAGALHSGYNGQAFSPLGDKGRFVLPPDFRKAVKASSEGRILCLAKHDRWNCLIGFGLSRKPELEYELDREEEKALRLGRDYDRDLAAMQKFGFSEVSFDDSGRFIMPDHLATLARIEGGLYFHGAGKFFTLWNPAELGRVESGMEAAQVTCERLVADAEAKRK